MAHFDPAVPVQPIIAGKLRRYHHLTVWQHFTIPSVFWPNFRDIFLVIAGSVQSFCKLVVWRPDVIFAKGGFVCLPVGVAAKVLGIPLVIHDSDTHPGLTNRILAKWAVAIATGAPLDNYPYPSEKSTYIGIPINKEFIPFDTKRRQAAKQALGFDPERPLVVVTGGGLGSRRLNLAVAEGLDALLAQTAVLLVAGADQYDDLRALTPQTDPRYQLHAFISTGMAKVLGAADIVVARAGATTILELAALAKPTILVPNSYLTAGHQLKNAAEYAAKGAVVVLDEKELEHDPAVLVAAIKTLLADPQKARHMSEVFHSLAKPNAAKDMADIILNAAKKAS